MEVLYFLESIRNPVLDTIVLLTTKLGEETFFLILAMVMFWCVDKYKGYYMMSVGFVGILTSQFMKLWFRIPRPWVQDSNFTVVEGAKANAGDYSFPSGHSQAAVSTYGSLAYSVRKRWVQILCILAAVAVPISRLYLGVHTPLDVSVGAAISLVFVFALKPLFMTNPSKRVPWIMGAMVLAAIGYLCFVHLYPFPADVDAGNLASGIENGYTLLGAICGMVTVYIVDERWLRFSTKATPIGNFLKVLLGFALILTIKAGLKTPLNMLFGEWIGRSIRYFLMVTVAGIVWPLSFRFLAKTGHKNI